MPTPPTEPGTDAETDTDGNGASADDDTAPADDSPADDSPADDAGAPAPPGGENAEGGSTAPGSGLFDALYPRLLAPFHPEAAARREAAALRELLGLAQEDRVLDLGCGWGRHLSLLAEAGHRVTGVDLSSALLRLARDAAGPAASLAAADMRWLPLAGGRFDVVLNLATSLGLFLDDASAVAALSEARRVLRPGGRLLVEGMHRDDVVAGFAPRARWTLDDGTRVEARRRFDALAGVSREVLRWRGPLGRGERRHALRVRSATELVALMEASGLEVREAWGGWDGAAFRHDSDRLIVLAVRPPAAGRVAAAPA